MKIVENDKEHKAGRRAFLAFALGAPCGAVLIALRGSQFLEPPPVVAAGVPSDVAIIQFGEDGKKRGKVAVPHIAKSDEEWRQQLQQISYEVTRHAGTERAYTGATWNLHDKGLYTCICCDTALFNSATKFESGTGWPSFWEPIAKENVVETRDSTAGMERTAVSCRRCDAHLGHVFDDGPRPTGRRYCMNSAAMRFVKTA